MTLTANEQDLLLFAGVAVVVLLGVAGVTAGLLSGRRRQHRFLETARRHQLQLQEQGDPWNGLVAHGAVGGAQVEIGHVSSASVIRFRTRTARRLPPGLYVHTQPFRHNAAGPRQPGTPPYDGSADEAGLSALVGNVPEIVLSDPEMDRAFVIQADDERAARMFLSRPDVRGHLLSAAASGAHVRIRDASVELDVEHQELDSLESYERHLAQLLTLARVLEAASLG